MRKLVVLLATVAASLCVASTASAQWGQPLGGRLTLSVNGILQPGSQDVTGASSFTLYDEPAEVTTAQEIQGGGVLEIGGTYKVRDDFGIGLSYSFLRSEEGGTVSGSLPHPLFFDQPRTFTSTIDALEHKEHAVHLQAVWFLPFVENVDFALSAGPSFYSVTQEFASSEGFTPGDRFTEQPPDFNEVTINSIGTQRLKKSAVGFNLGGEVIYSVTRNVGFGGMLRYTRATADLETSPGQSTDVKAGNVQLGVGVRLRF